MLRHQNHASAHELKLSNNMGNLTKCSYFSLQWFPKTALSGPSLYPDVLRLSVLRALSDREKCSHKLRPHPRRHFYHELTFISEAFLKAVLNKITDNLLQRHHVVTGTITVLPILHIRHTWLPEVLMCQNVTVHFELKPQAGRTQSHPPGKHCAVGIQPAQQQARATSLPPELLLTFMRSPQLELGVTQNHWTSFCLKVHLARIVEAQAREVSNSDYCWTTHCWTRKQAIKEIKGNKEKSCFCFIARLT